MPPVHGRAEVAFHLVMPVAERVHRNDEDVPDEIITGLAEMGCFALSIAEEHGGFATGGDDDLRAR